MNLFYEASAISKAQKQETIFFVSKMVNENRLCLAHKLDMENLLIGFLEQYCGFIFAYIITKSMRAL